MTDNMRPHTFTIKRQATATRGSLGGPKFTYTTAARAGLPTKVSGRAIRMNQKEKIDHGVRGDRTGWKLLMPDGDPEITLEDQVSFDYVPGESHVVKVLVPSHARSADERFWKTLGEEDSTES